MKFIKNGIQIREYRFIYMLKYLYIIDRIFVTKSLIFGYIDESGVRRC